MALSSQVIGAAIDGDGNLALSVGPSGYSFSPSVFDEIDRGRAYVEAIFIIQLYLQLVQLGTDMTDPATVATAVNGLTVQMMV